MLQSTKGVSLLIGMVAFFAAFYNAWLPLHGDEAYYWVWSQHLQGGYFDHAPMVAFFIKAATFLSDSEWGIRLVGVVSLALSAGVVYRIARDFIGPRSAPYALLIFLVLPLTHGGFIIANPDGPLILFWTLALYTALQALQGTKRPQDFLLTGLFLGLAMLSKYTAILLPASLLLYMVFYRRDLLYASKTWGAILIASLIVSPMLWWNYHHEWISFTFQLEHGGVGSRAMQFKYVGDFIGGQLVSFTPIFMGLAFYGINRASLQDTPALRLLSIAFLLPLLFFLYQSLHTHMEPNYPAPAYIAGTLIAAATISRYRLKRWFIAGLAFALVIVITARIALVCCLEQVQDRMVGFKEAVTLLAQHRREGDALYGNHLTTAALLSYYLEDHPETSVATDTRFSQYHLWDTSLRDGLVLSYTNSESNLKKRFASVQRVATYDAYKGKTPFRTFYIFRVARPKQTRL